MSTTIMSLVFSVCHSSFDRLLGNTLAVLKVHTSKNIADRLVNRKSRLSNLEKYDRLINDFNTNFMACFPVHRLLTRAHSALD
jgi:hypothetical protein